MARLHHKNEYCHGVSVIFKHKFAYRLTQVYDRNKSKNDLTLVKIFIFHECLAIILTEIRIFNSPESKRNYTYILEQNTGFKL